MELSAMADGGREVFERGRLIPPPGQIVRQAADNFLTQSRGVQLTLGRLTTAHLAKETPENGPDVTYQLRVTFFDRNCQYFFGRTWKSAPQKMKNNKMSLNEILYFHTSLRLPSTVLVLELVALSVRSDGSQLALGQGFTVLDLFPNKTEPQGDRRLNLLHGSPRILLHPQLKDTVDYGDLLKTIDGAHLECGLKGHPSLAPMMHLLPENVLVSKDENIPGLAPSPTGDALLKPVLLNMLPFTLHRLTVCLQPSLEAFENQLLELINADCQNTKQPSQDSSLQVVVIQERRLHVGVHNGWCFIDTPQVVVLEPIFAGFKGQAESTAKKNTQTKDSLTVSSVPQTLGLRSNLELKLFNHQAIAVIFQLEYVFSAPIGRETMLSATSTPRAAFLQCLRWAMLCPFQEGTDLKGEETQLVLQGGANPNPLGVMVYSTVQIESSAPPSGSAQVVPKKDEETLLPKKAKLPDTVKFRLSPSLDKTSSSPKTSLRTKLEDPSGQGRSASSPLQCRNDSQATPPESPPGPKLSLSQLAATSRYPTISQSSSGLPWQQSFPSLLHPSLTATAHQPSHVAYSAVSNISHLETDLRSVKDGSPNNEELQELPFLPAQAPVITAGMTAPSSSSVSSRGSLAHLYSAGFPDIVDSRGQVAEVLDPTEPVPFDPHREEMDPLQESLLVFQFLAFTRKPVKGVAPEWPSNIYFTFQFYRFPPVTSQQLRLLNSSKLQQKDGDPLPCVLTAINNDGSVNSDSPGLQVQFRVDDSFLKPGEKRWFLRYLALHTMRIDIWDSDSLLLIGSTAIELKYMLRHGKMAVQALHEMEVLTTDYVGEDTLQTDHASNNLTAVHSIVRGRLHIRTGNIGHQDDPSRRRAVDRTQCHSHIIIPREVTCGFTGGSLSSRNILQLNVRNTAQAQRLQVRRGRINTDGIFSGAEPDSGRRKLECMAAVHQKEGKKEGFKTTKSMDRTKRLTLTRQPYVTVSYEDLNKAEGISNMLCHAITTPHQIFASLGSAEYMEFVLKNPFNSPQTVTIQSDDPELSVITNIEEWQYFKELTRTPTSLEKDMFNMEKGAPGPKVYLRPKESVHIPLKYQSFLCDHNMTPQGPSFLPTSRSSPQAKKILSNIVAAKTIKASFKAENGDPIAICQLIVEPTPHVVDQTFRLYHPELSFLKKSIRLPPWHALSGSTVGGTDAKTHISVRCSDPNIICQTGMLVPGEPQDVFLKVPGSPSPNIKMFYVMVFTDEWMAAPSQIWQVYVHFMERVDVKCVTGQRSRQSLVLRGRQAARKVKCFSSRPQEIEVHPAGVFLLPPAAVQELQLKVQPWRAGSRFLYLNAVDVEQRQLVTAWLLCLNVQRPVLSKAFEVCVPANSGRGSSKKITYTNPYKGSRTFLLRSDHPDLLQFKEDTVQIDGGESTTIGLRFAPSRSPGAAEILVYVNNMEEKTEETFCVNVNYS